MWRTRCYASEIENGSVADNILLRNKQPLEIYVDDETKLTLHGLQQYYLKLEEREKNRKLNDLLDSLEFNQVSVFFVS